MGFGSDAKVWGVSNSLPDDMAGGQTAESSGQSVRGGESAEWRSAGRVAMRASQKVLDGQKVVGANFSDRRG